MRDKSTGIALALGIIGAVFAFAFISSGVLGGQSVASTDVTVRTADPTVNDDIDRGFLPGYQWVNQSNQKIYGLVSSGDGSADWDQLNGGGSGGGHVIQNEGSDLAQRTNLNFVGAGIFCDDTGVDTTTCTIGSAVHEFGVLFTDDTAPDAQVLATAGTFEVIVEYDQEGVSSSGVTINTGSNDITIDNAGTYAISYSASFSGSASREFDLQVFIDSVGQSASITHRSLSAAGAVGVAASGTIIVATSGGEVIDLRAAPEVNGDSITVFNGSLVVNEIQDFGSDDLPTLADDNVWTGSATNVATAVAIPDCNVTSIDRIQYDTTANVWSCQNAAIDLASEVSGIAPIANGGTGASTAGGARTALDVDQAGTDNSTNVTLAGTPDYITIAGQVITRGTIDISDDTNLAAGTGATLTDDTISVDLGTSIDLTAEVTGTLPTGNGGTGQTAATEDSILVGNGSTFDAQVQTDCNGANVNRSQYDTGTNTFVCDTDPIDLVNDITGTLVVGTGGTGTTTITSSEVVIGSGTSPLTTVATGTLGFVLTSNGALAPTWQAGGGGGSVAAWGRIEDNAATPQISMPLGWHVGTMSTRAFISGKMSYFPFHTPTQIGVDALVVEITSAAGGGALARACLYEADSNLRPGDLVKDAGTIAIDAVTVVTTSFTEETLVAGNYLLALVTDATVTFRAPRGFSPLQGAISPSIGASAFLQDMTISGLTADVAGGCADPATAPDTYTFATVGFYMPLFMRISTP